MTPQSQSGQALPAVLAIMLLLVLLAGGASMAVSAVLSQQRVNRASTDADLSTQNAVAATAANVGNGSSCGPTTAPPDTLFADDFQSPINGRWTFPSGHWQVQQDNGAPILAANDPGLNVATPMLAAFPDATRWSYYRVTVKLRPRSTAPGSSTELDAYYQMSGPGYSAYWLRLETLQTGQQRWRLGRTGSSSFGANRLFQYDTNQWHTLELDVFGTANGSIITARLDDGFLARRSDSAITSGSIAIRADDSQVQIASVSVDQPVPDPTMVTLSIPGNLPSPGLQQQFYCQRLSGVETGAISQQPAAVSNASACALLNNVSVTVPAMGGHAKVWFTVPWPSQITAGHVTVSLGGCPGSLGSADCGRQRSTIVPAPNPPWSPGLTVVGADCTNPDPSSPRPTRYSVYLQTSSNYGGNLPPMVVRSAAEGSGSVYMTVMRVRAASGEPYEESDILTTGGAAVLSYEGVLG